MSGRHRAQAGRQTSRLCIRVVPGSGRPGQGPRRPPDAPWTWAQSPTFSSLDRAVILSSAYLQFQKNSPLASKGYCEERKTTRKQRLLRFTPACLAGEGWVFAGTRRSCHPGLPEGSEAGTAGPRGPRGLPMGFECAAGWDSGSPRPSVASRVAAVLSRVASCHLTALNRDLYLRGPRVGHVHTRRPCRGRDGDPDGCVHTVTPRTCEWGPIWKKGLWRCRM